MRYPKKLLIGLGLPALILVLLLAVPVQGKRSFLEKLELLNIAQMIGRYEKPFTAEELEQLLRAAPSIKEDNPKLYKDRERTERILMLYMVLEQIDQEQKKGRGLGRLKGKSRKQVARDYVRRVYKKSPQSVRKLD